MKESLRVAFLWLKSTETIAKHLNSKYKTSTCNANSFPNCEPYRIHSLCKNSKKYKKPNVSHISERDGKRSERSLTFKDQRPDSGLLREERQSSSYRPLDNTIQCRIASDSSNGGFVGIQG